MAFLENDPDALKQILEEKANSGYEVFANGLKESGWWDENKYLGDNHDVAAAVNDGTFVDGLAHYISFGIEQNRQVGNKLESAPPSWDEGAYLCSNPTAVVSMMRGNSKNGYDHFLQNYDGKKLTGKFRNIDGVPLDWDEMAFLENDPDALKQILEEKANSGYEVFANRIKHAGLWDEDSYLLLKRCQSSGRPRHF